MLKKVLKQNTKSEQDLTTKSIENFLFNVNQIYQTTNETFLKFKASYNYSEFSRIKNLISADFYEDLDDDFKMFKNEYNQDHFISDVKINFAKIIYFRDKQKDDNPTLAIFIDYTSIDYEIFFDTKKFKDGTQEPQLKQEVWTFKMVKNSWILDDIDTASYSGYLENKTFILKLLFSDWKFVSFWVFMMVALFFRFYFEKK